MAHLKLPAQIIEVRHVDGKADKTKKYTMVGAVITLPDGKQGYAEMLLSDTHHYTPGQYIVELDVSIDRDKRLGLRASGFVAPAPVQKQAG